MTDSAAIPPPFAAGGAELIDGRAMAAAIRGELRATVEKLSENGVRPGLAVALVGEDPASAVYVGGKIKACKEIGIRSIEARLSATTTTAQLIELIDDWNADDSVDGILVQLPLPKGIDTQAVVERIAPDKVVD